MKRLFAAAAASVLGLTALAPEARACLWDSDTIAMERQHFPDAFEAIAGHLLKHSRTYYEWRLMDRPPRLTADASTVPLYDDLAVAYDKLGDRGHAIFVMELVETLTAGRYETYANLGTFFLHAGELEKGINLLDVAIQINSEAHFGREVYQKALAEYFLERRKAGATLPLRDLADVADAAPGNPGILSAGGFAAFLEKKKIPRGQAAVKGILGMMHFGDATSPVLLEALGDLLLSPEKSPVTGSPLQRAISAVNKDARHLATRAYLRASQTAPEAAKAGYRKLAAATIAIQRVGMKDVKLEDVEHALGVEVGVAEAFVKRIADDESAWAAAGKNLDQEFAKKYYKVPYLPPGNR